MCETCLTMFNSTTKLNTEILKIRKVAKQN